MKLKLHIEATVSTTEAIMAVTQAVQLLKSEAGVIVDDFSLNQEASTATEVAVEPPSPTPPAPPSPFIPKAITDPNDPYHRPWMTDPRCVFVADTTRIDVPATLKRMGYTMEFLNGKSYRRGTLECAVKNAYGQNHRPPRFRNVARNGNGNGAVKAKATFTAQSTGSNGRVQEFDMS